MKIILTLSAVFVFVLSSYIHDSFADSILQVGSDVQLSGALLDKPFVLHLNETKLITSDNIRIKLVNITNDSRCPSGVTCIWQGTVHVGVSVKKDGLDYGGIGLELGGDSSAEIPIFDKYFIQLLRVEPYPQSTHTIQTNEYVATFIVKKTKVESPLQQFKSGIPINQIQCKENYVVLLKPNKEFGGCFRSDNAMKLYARGWPSPNDSTGIFQNQKTAKKEEYSLGGGTSLNQDNVSSNNTSDNTQTKQKVTDQNHALIKHGILYAESSYLGKVDLPSEIPKNSDGKINYDQFLHIIAREKYTKIFEKNNMSIAPNGIFLITGPSITMYTESGYVCGYAYYNNQTFWLESRLNKDTLTELKIYNDNPDKCRPSYSSCFCEAQQHLAEQTHKQLSNFDESAIMKDPR